MKGAMSKLSWEDAQTFLAVAETGSFSAAATRLKLGQPTISRRIKTLEEKVTQQLFIRGKHGAVPTPAAEQLMPAANQMAKWAAEFDRAARGSVQADVGWIKIASPPGVAVEQLGPFAAWLAEHEPNIRLEILSSIDHVNLARGAADIAVRTQKPTEPELVALHEFSVQSGVYGARSYVEKLPKRCRWSDLDWVTWADRYQHLEPRPMLEKVIPNFSPVLASDDYLVQKAAVQAGLGVMICNSPGKAETAPLLEVDVGVTLPKTKFYLVCAKSMQHIGLVKTVVNLIVANVDESVHTQ